MLNFHNFLNGFQLSATIFKQWFELMCCNSYGDIVLSKYYIEIWQNPIQTQPCWEEIWTEDDINYDDIDCF